MACRTTRLALHAGGMTLGGMVGNYEFAAMLHVLSMPFPVYDHAYFSSESCLRFGDEALLLHDF